MSEKKNDKNTEISSKDSGDVIALLKRMQRQLDSMEEKIDALTRQSKPRAFGDKRSSAPRKEFGGAKRKHAARKEEVSSDGMFFHGHPFGNKKDSGKSSFKKNRKSYGKTSR